MYIIVYIIQSLSDVIFFSLWLTDWFTHFCISTNEKKKIRLLVFKISLKSHLALLCGNATFKTKSSYLGFKCDCWSNSSAFRSKTFEIVGKSTSQSSTERRDKQLSGRQRRRFGAGMGGGGRGNVKAWRCQTERTENSREGGKEGWGILGNVRRREGKGGFWEGRKEGGDIWAWINSY